MGMAARLDDFQPAPLAPLMRVAALRKSYGGREVLRGIDLDVMRGEVLALIGGRGAGKSTLLRCLSGLEHFQHGALELSGRPLRQQVGLIFEGLDLQPRLSAGENVMRAPALQRKGSAAEDARELLARVGLAEQFDALPGQLTLGQQQRVAFARALAMEPTLLLCDEVTAVPDAELAGEVGLVAEALAGEGMTLLMATHDLDFAHRVADRVVFMHQGRVLEAGAPAELFCTPRTPELRNFLSSRNGQVRSWPPHRLATRLAAPAR